MHRERQCYRCALQQSCASNQGLPCCSCACAVAAADMLLFNCCAGHPSSVDAILKYDEDSVLTGCSDGLIRILSLQPNKMLGIIGEHAGKQICRRFCSDLSLQCAYVERKSAAGLCYLCM